MHKQDQQQYRLIKEYLQEFENGQLKLGRLINLLEGLIGSLQEVDKEWKDTFQSEWWTLEQVYAVARDRQEAKLSLESQNLVIEAIENMKHLLKEIENS